MIAIYKTQGLTEEEALVVTRIFAKDKTLFANLMMVEELGYSRLTPPRLSEAAVNVGVPTVLGFVAGVFIPISSLFLQRSLRRPGGGAAAGDFGDSRAHRLTSLLPRPLVRFLGELTLAACCAILGALNTEVFFGAYSHFKLRMKLIAMSLAGAGSVYALSFITTKCF
ncbi:unnamed protein product [Phytomonas sp. Hart1]|nr:unnamed protein product [Phytomonas sp. Hart1]|eukprot:CCW67308.1 unnamed protein product [Phytomonas sp. isolate Hart1]